MSWKLYAMKAGDLVSFELGPFPGKVFSGIVLCIDETAYGFVSVKIYFIDDHFKHRIASLPFDNVTMLHEL